MDSIGSRNKVSLANRVIRESYNPIFRGFHALSQIHQATADLVEHEGESLLSQLGTPDVLRTYVLALIVEAGEFIQTLDWKPWRKNDRVTDMDKTVDELADIIAFVGMIILVLNSMGVSTDEISAAYLRKELINVKRFEAAARGEDDRV